MSRDARDPIAPDGAPRPGTSAGDGAVRWFAPWLGLAAALALAAAFVALTRPVLDTVPHDFDEAWLLVDARMVAAGARPFVDFAHHEPPLQIYLLELAGAVFGETIAGWRMLSLLALAASGVAVYALARPYVGLVAALVAEALLLFAPAQGRALTAVPETPALAFALIGTALALARRDRRSAPAAAAFFVLAILTKPTAIVSAGVVAVALACGREWRRLRDFVLAGAVASAIGLAWVGWLSDGVFLEVLRFQLTRVGTRSVGMLAIDSGFADMKQMLGIATPFDWAVLSFQTFFLTRIERLPTVLLIAALLAIPLWIGCAVRRRPAMAFFAPLWPLAYVVLNFVVMDFVSPRYFIPYLGFVALLASGWAWLAERIVGPRLAAGAAALAVAALAVHFTTGLGAERDLWFWGRTDWIGREHRRVVSFSPILFAATGAEPGCGFTNPALTYGAFGENFLRTERTQPFRFSDERLIACLRADPDLPIVVDWAFYFFTRPGSALRTYLAGEGSAHRLFFSPESVEQWDRPLLRMSPFR